MRKPTLILGITGSIASGKSLVATAFEKRGAALVSADQLARDVVRPGSEVLARLVKRFGEGILGLDDSLDREKLAQIVFGDEQARSDLNDITHPAIGKLATERLQALTISDVPLVAYEAPLLFEAKAENRVDKVLVVKVDPQIQLQRLMDRDGLSQDAALQRVAAQMSQEDKLARADYIIDNSGPIDATMEQIDELWQRLVNGMV